MSVLKLLGVLLLTGSGIGGACWLSGRASIALSQVEGLLSLLRLIQLQVECFAMPASSILARCDRKLLRQCGYRGNDIPTDFRDFARQCEIADPTAAEIFRTFAEEFGRGYREEQARGCEYSSGLLEERRAVLAEQLPMRKKLYSTLCVSGAVALMILFL
ncbi:MAG: hypothetical protein IJY47_07075 [Clostridia bacterium]|nr:hypothetical protein [Clostridia bacterium]